MTPADAEAVCAFLRSTHETSFLDWETPEVVRGVLERCPGHGYVIEDAGAIIACVFITDGLRGVLNHMQVHPDYRQRGLGSTIVKAILRDFFHRTKVRRIQAIVGTHNETAISFWKSNSLGFRETTTEGGEVIAFALDLTDQPWLNE
jgi:ribosomal protein S18 acetylase RimI-like enzyme